MENEKKVTEKVTEKKIEENKLFVERESFKGNDGKDYWAYLVKGQVRGREVKVDFAPKDKGGYEPLDIVFDVAPKAELIMSEEEIVNDTGKATKYTSYKVQTIDEDGIPYVCSVRPIRDSDKALLLMLINQMNKKTN